MHIVLCIFRGRRHKSYDTSATAEFKTYNDADKDIYPADTRPETAFYDNPGAVSNEETESLKPPSYNSSNGNGGDDRVSYTNETFGKSADTQKEDDNASKYDNLHSNDMTGADDLGYSKLSENIQDNNSECWSEGS